ncbi:dynamin family protein [Salicibibacter cibarius]|uniref:Dynamin family protein n=1 Tax=Salicibibacter cibarius TaxID=2743000 RepID=A0A7T6Z2Z5_9BACI|nr:dynamin family protein [Salicibibacter cibarius]QQK76048.1 dynamin family protein [Salicibibacter cibarius]
MTTETLTPLEERKRTLPFGEPEKARLEKLDGKLAYDAPFSVAVCGHFSAGKSTLLNHLLGAELLPSSPIPTTANIMTIAAGDPGLTAITNDGETHVFTDRIPWEKLQSFALDGVGIREVKLSLPLPFLPENVTLADTPGVDSTDGTHESYTGTELLTTDAIIYITDYNHVRSETNLRFLRQMQRENKPIVLVVNQIDKHDENELPFSIFSHGLRDMLQRFDIHPIGIYFTSAHQLDHPENEITNWIGDMRSLLYHATSLKDQSKMRMIRSAVSALLERLYRDRARGEQAIEDSLQAHGFSVGDHQTLVQIRERLKRLDEETREAIADMRHRLDEFFKQTYLFPNDLMEGTKTWIESLDPSFKVGVLGSKKKKTAEQEKREEALIEALNRRWDTEVHLYLSEYFKKLSLSPSIARHAEAAVQAIPFRAGEAGWLRSFVSDGVKNDQYVYTLASRLNHALLKEVKDVVEPLYREIVADFEQQAEDERFRLLEKTGEFEEIETLEAENEEHLKTIDDTITRVKASLETLAEDGRLEEDMKALLGRSPDLDGLQADIEVSEQAEPVSTKMNAVPRDEFSQEAKSLPQVDWQALKETVEQYMSQPYAEDEREDLLTTIEKAQTCDYTFVMAGAFSAGKSTFLNALVRDEIMPVSPHPTTASLTVVRYPDETHQHGDVTVQIKSEAVLDAEIQAVAYECGYTFNLTRLKNAEGLSIAKTNTLEEKQRLEYLRALQLAVKKEQYDYGKTYDMSMHDWQEIAAKEDHACLIEESTVYFHSDITGKGWSLVDTPGVQSVNERHTRMAIEKIKKADRFMYLTYYHHAFSRADQSFIKRITEVQVPHYMVINAADLAKDEQEAQYVTSFVNDQLKQAGCHESITVPLSSKRALAPEGDRRFSDFMHYLETEEGPRLQMESVWEMNRQMHTLIDALHIVADIGKRPLEERKKLAEQEKQTYEGVNLKNVDADDGEIKVWEGHATRRLLLVFADRFAASIHVASVNGKDKSARESQLLQALDAFIDECEEEWQKEQLALEKQARASLREQMTRAYGDGRSLEDMDVRLETAVDFQLPVQSLQTLAKQRKLKKSFFYDGEFDAFKTDVFSLLEEHVRARVQIAAESVRKGKKAQLGKIKAQVQKEMEIKEKKQADRLQFLTSEEPDVTPIEEEIKTLKSQIRL